MATILEQKAQIDKLWETFWSNGISNPLTVIEQISYLFFIKELDEKHTLEERKALRLNRTIQNPVFDETEKQQKMRWSKFKHFAPSEMFEVVQKDVFPFIKTMGGENFAKYMKDAILMIQSPALLASAVDMIDKLEMQNLDTKGDLYEYLLSKIAQAGVNGQFRTPRHIGKMMVELADIQPNDIVCDPSCGTAGFLICAIMYLKEHYRDMFYDTQKLEHFNNTMFYGYDFDFSMLRIASMNMMTHGHQNPNIEYQDSLSEDAAELKDKFTCVIANPPFKGSLNKDTIAKNLTSDVSTTKTELLFLALMVRILKAGGRACVIVPDGVLFGTSNAHKDVRKLLIDKQKLEAVISMPSGVFKPYAGVSTAILIFTKTNIGGTDKVWFYDMQNDGFTLNDNRTPIEENDIPDIIKSFKNRYNEDNSDKKAKHFFVDVDEIRNNGYDLSINKYKEIEYEEVQYEEPSKILADIKQLEKILFENSDIGSREQLKVLQQNLGLGEFIRSIIGVERSEIEKIFSEYLDNNKFNSNQIRFVETIIDYIRNNGTMDTAKLFEQPFTFINAEGLDGVFAPKDADNIIYLIDGINQNAHILEG